MSSRAAGSFTRARRTPCGGMRRSSHAISDSEGHEMKRIAIIGVGLLGGAVASRLLEGAFAVRGYDSRPDQLARLAPRGLTPATSVKDAAAGAGAVFAAVARKTIHVGPVGSASLAKLATNLLVGLNTAALAEALVLGEKGGLAPRALLDILRESAAASKMVEVRGPLMVDERFEPQMKLDLFLKDFRLMLEEGQRLGVPLPLTKIGRAHV